MANRYVWSAISGLEKTAVSPHANWKDYLAAHKGDSNPLIIFDQFEEILRVDAFDTAAKRDFFEHTGEMLRDPGIWALFIIREGLSGSTRPLCQADPHAFSESLSSRPVHARRRGGRHREAGN